MMMIQTTTSQHLLMFMELLPDDLGENQQRGQNPDPRPQEYYRGYDNIVDSDGPLVFPPLPRATHLW